MWSSKEFLGRCEQLKEAGIELQLGPGRRIARGFADLGYEEFYSLSGSKMASIYTGHTSELPPEHQKFFFLVPGFDTLVDEIVRRDFDLVSLEFLDQRDWQLQVRHVKSLREIKVKHREALCCLAGALLEILKQSH